MCGITKNFTLFALLLLLVCFQCIAQNRWTGGGGDDLWENGANWDGGVPDAADDVEIPQGSTNPITINSAAVCNTFTMDNSNGDQNVNIIGSNSLTVTGAVVIGVGTTFLDNVVLNVNSGTLTCASITTTAPTGVARSSEVNATDGTINVSGDILNGDEMNFSGAATMTVGGNMTGGAFADGTSTVIFNGTDQSMSGYTFHNLTLSGSGTVDMSAVGTIANNLTFAGPSSVDLSSLETIGNNFTLDGSVSAAASASIDIGGDLTLESGSIFNAGSFSHAIDGDLTNNGGTFTSTGIVTLDGAGQTIGGSSATNFRNLILGGTGTKVFSNSTTISEALIINTGAIANLGAITTHTASRLTLAGTGGAAGTWGSTSSAATNQNNTFFSAGTTGFITTTVAGGTTYFTRATGNWTTNATWSTVDFGGTAATSFPTGTDVVNIGGGDFTVTVTGNQSCGQLSFQQDQGNDVLLTISGSNSLAVSGVISLTNAGGFFSGDNNTLAVGGGTLTAEQLAFSTGGFGSGGAFLTISTGTTIISGNVSFSGGNNADLTFTGAGRLELGADMIDAADLDFTPSTGTVEYNGTSNQRIGSLTYYNLVINNTSGTIPGLTLGGGATITNQLTMTEGVINLDGNTLTLGDGGASTLSRTASTSTNWMYGGAFERYWPTVAITSNSANFYGLFPVGSSSSSSYRPTEINSTVNPTGAGDFSVTHVNGIDGQDLTPFYDDGGTDILRKHNSQNILANTGITGGTYNLRVSMTDLNDIGVLADIRLAKSTGATTVTSSGTNVLATGSAENPTAGRDGVSIANLVGDWRITTTNVSNTPLPVELLDFNGQFESSSVSLTWTTASEINNSYFELERSMDGLSFQKIAEITGNGTTNQQQDYFYEDKGWNQGLNFYRLKQVDFDGQFEYFKPIVVQVEKVRELAINIYPNPVARDLSIEIDGMVLEVDPTLIIYDMQGHLAHQESVSRSSSTWTLRDLNKKLRPGMYFVSVHLENQVLKRKIIVY